MWFVVLMLGGYFVCVAFVRSVVASFSVECGELEVGGLAIEIGVGVGRCIGRCFYSVRVARAMEAECEEE